MATISPAVTSPVVSRHSPIMPASTTYTVASSTQATTYATLPSQVVVASGAPKVAPPVYVMPQQPRLSATSTSRASPLVTYATNSMHTATPVTYTTGIPRMVASQTKTPVALNRSVNAECQSAPTTFAPVVESKGTNTAFVFIKPHAVTPAVEALVYGYLVGAGMSIVAEGEISSEQIDENQLIDQHYYAIASKATILKPAQLNVPKDKFASKFGIAWDDALEKGLVFNAMDACELLRVNAEQMADLWNKAKKEEKLVKFGGGFYCGEMKAGSDTIYVFNGFFMSMRAKFTQPGKKIHYYIVQWDAAKLSWADFRGQVLGPTDPATAPESSLRGILNASWERFGLDAALNTGDNGVHASASPFEGLAERMNWLNVPLQEDAFGSQLLSMGVSEEYIMSGCVDPQVKLDSSADNMGSLFDALEDMDEIECARKVHELSLL